MLKWLDILKFANNGNPQPPRRVEKSNDEWQSSLSEEVYSITRLAGTERPGSSEMCYRFDPGIYACACCGEELFDSTEKFDSGTGWPSFSNPLTPDLVKYVKDYGLTERPRIEIICNICDSHLGHVFPDGPPPSGLRYCVNALSLQKVVKNTAKAIFGGGCFWCTEAMFQELDGVSKVVSGYTGGHVHNPTYKEVCTGNTGHAEAVEITYDPDKITFKELLQIFMATHDPTTLNRQGNDIGTQYRSAIFYHNDAEKQIAEEVIKEMQSAWDDPIVTEVTPLEVFYNAEEYHQDYFNRVGNENSYCTAVVNPKVIKFKKLYADKLKR